MRPLFLACILCSVPSFGAAQDKVGVRGVVHKIDVQNGTITLRPGKLGAKEPVTLNLYKPDIEVTSGLGRAKLTDLLPGHVVQLQMRTEEDVEAIRVEDPVVHGALVAIDRPNQMLRVLSDGLAAKLVHYTPGSKFLASGKAATSDMLQTGQWLEITTALDGKTARVVEAHPPGTRNGRLSSGRLAGTIVALEPEAGSVFFQQAGRDKLLSFAVPESTAIWVLYDSRAVEILSGRHAIAAKPAVMYLEGNRSDVKRIEVDAPVVRCLVKGVDLKARTLTVRDGEVVSTWKLPEDVRVLDGRKKKMIEVVRPDAKIDLVLSLDRKDVRAIIVLDSRD